MKNQQSLEEQEAVRTILVESKSCNDSSMEEENGDNSCYYPGCKKDANCNCEICLDSINATLDMPFSSHKSTLTELSASKPSVECTPISFDDSILSTPTSSACDRPSTPVLKSSARSDLNQKMENQNKGQEWCFSGVNLFRLLLVLGFLLSADVVFPWVVSGIFQPSLSPDVVRKVGEKCFQVPDLNGKLRFLQKELASVVVGNVLSCSFADSLWEIKQDGLLLHSRCRLYKSAMEEVTIWGWPLQTAGLLSTEFSSRTLTVLSGRVTEWNGGQIGYLIRKANTSWVQPKWGASAVQLDPNTWVLEYRRSSISDGASLYPAALKFLKYRISNIIGRVKKDFWVLAAFEDNQHKWFTANNRLLTPT